MLKPDNSFVLPQPGLPPFKDSAFAPKPGFAPAQDCAAPSGHSIAIELSYDGAGFVGFAQQEGQRSVQGSLNEALELLFKRPVPTVCAGRTDAGVHALRQVVSFDVSAEEFAARSLEELRRSLDALTDKEIDVRAIEEKPFGFSARFDAKAREYRYFISTSKSWPPLIGAHVWHLGRELDVAAMREAGYLLVGEHDFKSFCTASSAIDKPTQRRIIGLSVGNEELLGEEVVVIKIVGNAFLHSMVRTIVGTLVLVGLGKRPPSWVAEVLKARDRCAAGQNAPAQGLVFWRVFY